MVIFVYLIFLWIHSQPKVEVEVRQSAMYTWTETHNKTCVSFLLRTKRNTSESMIYSSLLKVQKLEQLSNFKDFSKISNLPLSSMT